MRGVSLDESVLRSRKRMIVLVGGQYRSACCSTQSQHTLSVGKDSPHVTAGYLLVPLRSSKNRLDDDDVDGDERLYGTSFAKIFLPV